MNLLSLIKMALNVKKGVYSDFVNIDAPNYERFAYSVEAEQYCTVQEIREVAKKYNYKGLRF